MWRTRGITPSRDGATRVTLARSHSSKIRWRLRSPSHFRCARTPASSPTLCHGREGRTLFSCTMHLANSRFAMPTFSGYRSAKPTACQARLRHDMPLTWSHRATLVMRQWSRLHAERQHAKIGQSACGRGNHLPSWRVILTCIALFACGPMSGAAGPCEGCVHRTVYNTLTHPSPSSGSQ